MQATEKDDLIVPVRSKVVAVASIKPSPYNPPERWEAKNIKARIGINSASGPAVSHLDHAGKRGHRGAPAPRVRKALGWAVIEARVVEQDPDEIYASVNVSSRKMSSREMLFVYLRCPQAVSPYQQRKHREMEQLLGRPLVKMILAHGYSWVLFRIARETCRYCGDETPERLQQCVRWLLEVPGQIPKVRLARKEGQSPAAIDKAIRDMKPLKYRLAED